MFSKKLTFSQGICRSNRWCLNQNSIRFQNNFTAPPSQRSPSLLIFQTRPRAYAPLPIFLCFDSWLFIRFSKGGTSTLDKRIKISSFTSIISRFGTMNFLKWTKDFYFRICCRYLPKGNQLTHLSHVLAKILKALCIYFILLNYSYLLSFEL